MKRVVVALTILLLLLPDFAQAQRRKLVLIRDAEIENTIRAYSQPVFRAAGLGGRTILIHLVKDRRLNAFVANGRHIFINTGLLIGAKSPDQVIGVIAHETGHIVGNHQVGLRQALREAQIMQIISFLLAAAVGAAARDGRAAVATAGLGSKITEGTFLKYTRSHERAADSFALHTLERMGISARGLMEFLQVMADQELLYTTNQDPYIRTHPLTRRRIDLIRNHLKTSRYASAKLPTRYYVMHKRMRAKLIGFLKTPGEVVARYQGREKTIEARYALAVAYHRTADTEKSLALIDSLLKEQPKDPYFHELKGQILLESARAAEAVEAYRKAVRILPNEPLIQAALGHAMLEAGDARLLKPATRHLRIAVRRDPFFPMGWYLLGRAYGRQKQYGLSSLALAEHYLLLRDRSGVVINIRRAEKHLRRGSPAWRRLQDIKMIARFNKKKK